MILRNSCFLHILSVGEGRHLAIHGISQLRLTIDPEIKAIFDYFQEPRQMPEDLEPLQHCLGQPQDRLLNVLSNLLERGFLTDQTPDQEKALLAQQLSSTHGRDPDHLLEHYRRLVSEGSHPGWAVARPLDFEDLGIAMKRLEVILLGECDIQMETDFLRREGRARSLDLRITTGFPDDFALAAERPHDLIIIGALRSRRTIVIGAEKELGDNPGWLYRLEAENLLKALRQVTDKPILLDNLPEPTVSPLGLAERGRLGHRNRFRHTNLALSDLVETFDDVHLIDIAASLNAEGGRRYLDDALVGFTHFGSPGWMLQRPESERVAVFDQFPDLAPLASKLAGNPYGREEITAKAHIDAIISLTGHQKKKCVILDLDGTLWPGVLAETGAPFGWAPEISGAYSYIGLWFGLHEALKALKARGVVLACVSKNDEAVIRQLWHYPDHYPKDRLLTLEDFVAIRINWGDKVENIKAISEDLGFRLEDFLFIDDNPVERARVEERLPCVEVWGEDLFGLRFRLLTDPRLQIPKLTDESKDRTHLVKAQKQRIEARAASVDEDDFLKALEIVATTERIEDKAKLSRIVELFQRTTQYNATGRPFSVSELAALIERKDAAVYSLFVKDRYGDHGLCGAAVVEAGQILGFVMSCRVIGLKVEINLLEAIINDPHKSWTSLRARIIPTERNTPIRNLYHDNGFSLDDDGFWYRNLEASLALSA